MSETALWGSLGILVAIIVGLLTVRRIKVRKSTQNQKVGDNSKAIQSGRDTNIGGDQ